MAHVEPIASAELRRIGALYAPLPSTVTAVLIGVLVTCLFLYQALPLDALKVWVTYMLTTLAGRTWLWYRFLHAPKHEATLWRWEAGFTVGGFATAIGWAALAGPLYPSGQLALQTFVVLLLLMVSFSGAIFAATSRLCYVATVLPTLLPPILRYVEGISPRPDLAIVAGIAAVIVFLILQRSLYQFTIRTFSRGEELELLLAEQHAIFESATMGIVVLHEEQVVKSNKRLGELLGRGLQDLAALPVTTHFISAEEAASFIEESRQLLTNDRPVQGIYRLRRADGSQFWAEFSGRSMGRQLPDYSVWLIADVTLRMTRQA